MTTESPESRHLDEIERKIAMLNRNLVTDPRTELIEDILTDVLLQLRSLRIRLAVVRQAVGLHDLAIVDLKRSVNSLVDEARE